MTKQEKARENWARVVAARRGYRLVKCRRRDPLAVGYGTWHILDDRGRVVAGDILKFGLTISDAEKWLKDPKAAPDLTAKNA